jgi:hypothetical protein
MSSNHQVQHQERKFYPCRRNCGTQVTFDNKFKSKDGSKLVPLVFDSVGQLTQHNCPNWKPGRQQQQQEPPTTSPSSPSPKQQPSSTISQSLTAIESKLEQVKLEIIALKAIVRTAGINISSSTTT